MNKVYNLNIIVVILIIHFSIWQHMLKLTRSEKKTIIITTHYIEEARQAQKVSVFILFVCIFTL